jgi:branched-subunit amino acid aminotransferase/4-amino-4-deoxychorismate lyase
VISWCYTDDLENGINAATVEDIRWLRCDIKSLNLLGNVLAKEYAKCHNNWFYFWSWERVISWCYTTRSLNIDTTILNIIYL